MGAFELEPVFPGGVVSLADKPEEPRLEASGIELRGVELDDGSDPPDDAL